MTPNHLKIEGELFWPPGDKGDGGIPGWGPAQWVEAQVVAAVKFASLVPFERRHTAVCAGAHIGIMPLVYHDMGFQSVLAFEPDPENFHCLLRNTTQHGASSVRAIESALGATSGSRRWMMHNVENSGASYLIERPPPETLTTSSSWLTKAVDVLMLDEFHLKALDLLQLDVEGYEWYALEGAANTIRMHRPVIVLEMQPRFDGRYRRGSQDVLQWLRTMDYFEAKTERIDHDRVFRPITKGFT